MRKLFILTLLFFTIILNGVVFNVLQTGDHGHSEEASQTDKNNKKETHTETPKKKQTQTDSSHKKETNSKTNKHDNM